MHDTHPLKAQWHWTGFIALHLGAAALLLSMTLPGTAGVWQSLGETLFLHLNGTLGSNPIWDTFWAFTNTRFCDALVAVLMLVMLMRGGCLFPKSEVRPHLIGFLILLVILLLIRLVFAELVALLHWQHVSPSAVLPAYPLAQNFPTLDHWLDLKDRSARSFPGDHASILLLWAAYVAIHSNARRAFLTTAIALIFILPRLVAGAHWLDDVAVGSVFLVMVTLAWGYMTPVAAFLQGYVLRLLQPLLPHLRKLPIIGGWSLLN